jgi:hypothetical protein
MYSRNKADSSHSCFRSFLSLCIPNSGFRGLQASTPVPALFTVCGGFRGKGFRGNGLRLFTHLKISYVPIWCTFSIT